MFKPTILIGTLLVSHLTGVCCTMAIPEISHHDRMMHTDSTDTRRGEDIKQAADDCNSGQMENTSLIERDLSRGCIISERMKSGDNDGANFVVMIPCVSILSHSAASRMSNRHRYQSASPPELIDRASSTQLLL